MIAQGDLSAFNAELAEFGRTLLPHQLVLFHQKIALQVLRGVVFKTPVDTGRARGGWQTTINHYRHDETGTTDRDGSATFTAGVSALATLPPYSVVYINNNVEYMTYLEEGSSEQAPQGMIALTLEEVRQQFR